MEQKFGGSKNSLSGIWFMPNFLLIKKDDKQV